MTDLTQRELFDAIERSLRRTGRRFTQSKLAIMAKKNAQPLIRTAKSKALSKKSNKPIVRRKARG